MAHGPGPDGLPERAKIHPVGIISIGPELRELLRTPYTRSSQNFPSTHSGE